MKNCLRSSDDEKKGFYYINPLVAKAHIGAVAVNPRYRLPVVRSQGHENVNIVNRNIKKRGRCEYCLKGEKRGIITFAKKLCMAVQNVKFDFTRTHATTSTTKNYNCKESRK